MVSKITSFTYIYHICW